MKWLIPLVAGMLAAFLAYAIWTGFIEDSGTKGTSPSTTEGQDDTKGQDGDSAKKPEKNRAKNAQLPAWLQRGPITMTDNRSKRWDGLPLVIGELEAITRGRDKYSVNNVTLKIKLNELRIAMASMSKEEQEQLAEYFRASEDPTLKYYLMASFRNWGGEAYVDAIAEYYEAEPEMVGESLMHLMGRTPKAVEAMERLIDDEIDPFRKAKLVARAAYLGAPGTESLMLKLFNKKNSVGRRQAIPGLAKLSSPEGHQELLNLIDGKYEKAAYLPEESAAISEEMNDLRCHAVLALLQNGSDREIESLLDRALREDTDESVASYVDQYFPTVKSSAWIPKVIDNIVAKGKVSPSMLMYLSRRAESKDIPQLERLLASKISEKDLRIVQETLDRLR